jgi:electron transfer flavoprotein alpha/beta subunit
LSDCAKVQKAIAVVGFEVAKLTGMPVFTIIRQLLSVKMKQKL